MSRTMTISSCSASNVTVRCFEGSSCSPAKISSYMSAMRAGVRTSPSRSGSSPIASRISRTAFSIRPLSTPMGAPRSRLASRSRLRRAARIRHVVGRRRARPSRTHAGERLDAGEDLLHALDLQRLVRDELVGETVQGVAIRLEDLACGAVRVLDETTDFGVDAGRDLLGVVGPAGEVAAEEHLALRLAEPQRPELLAHPELRDHLPRDRGGAVDVVLRARGRVGEDELLRGATTEQHGEFVDQLAAPH